MPELSRAAQRASEDLAVDDDAETDASSDRDGEEVLQADAGPEPLLRDRQAIHVVVDPHRYLQLIGQRVAQRNIAPVEDVRVAADPLGGIDQSADTNPDSKHAFANDVGRAERLPDRLRDRHGGRARIARKWRF